MVSSYKDLLVWQRAIELSFGIYRLTDDFPRREIYGLTNQLRRAGVSVASNIAEGYGRGSRGEYKQFLSIARGSNLEVQTQLVIARGLGYGQLTVLETTNALSEEVSKMLYSLIGRL
jgi:four helix bundle protein